MSYPRVTKASRIRVKRGKRWMRATAIRVQGDDVWFITSRVGKWGHAIHHAPLADVVADVRATRTPEGERRELERVRRQMQRRERHDALNG